MIDSGSSTFSKTPFLERRQLYLRLLAYHARSMFRPHHIAFYARFACRLALGRKPDGYVVSFPKSGRTWLEQMLIHGICHHHGFTEHFETIQDLASAQPKLPRVVFTHVGSSWEGIIHSADQIRRMRTDKFESKPVVVLLRDPRDVLVSAYHHLAHRTRVPNIDKQDMIESTIIGLPKVIAFMNLWMEYAKRRPDQSCVLRYEQMKADPVSSLRKVSDMLGLRLSKESVLFAVEQCEFERMNKKERQGEFKSPRLNPADRADPSSFKTRKGKVGEHQTFFSAAQNAQIDALIEQDLTSSLPYYREAHGSERAG